MSDPLNPFPGNLRQHQVKPTEKDPEVTVTQRAKLEPSSRPDMLTDEDTYRACRSAPVRWACVEGRIVASVCCTPPFHSLNR